MKLKIYNTSETAGAAAAKQAAEVLNAKIDRNGSARIVLSTGMSQISFFDAIVRENVDWSRVEMFHLDEYVGVGREHKASFVRYLQEKFVGKGKLKAAYFVDGTGDVQRTVRALEDEVKKNPLDLGMIGIGENTHIAFNDPPADFDSDCAYKVVTLSDSCKRQQVNEGWFADMNSVCKQAITMTCRQILKCESIICLVPYKCKAEAVKRTLESDVTNTVPATLLKTHKDCTLYCDADSSSRLSDGLRKKYLSAT
ncbi:glucosamine-6-phosphate deaminase [Clostridia bacterium]|nr:glucosamine-6-phosphate deaminase [Clostridia bacterium]